MSEPDLPTASPKKGGGLGTKIFLGIIALIVISIIAGSHGGSVSQSAGDASSDQATNLLSDEVVSDTPTPIDDTSWIPSGFHNYGSGVAWRWGTSAETNCTYGSGSCWSVMVIARDGCPTGLYAEIAILDKSDVQIDFTNDTSTNVPPMQKVKLTFDTFNDAAETARLSKLDCTA